MSYLTRACAAAAIAASVSFSATIAHAESFKFTAVAGHPAIFLWVKHLKETLIPTVNAELEKTGNHSIAWNEAYGGTLAKVGGELEAIEEGLAEIGFNPSLFNPAKLPMQNVAFIAPFNSDNPSVVTGVVEQLQTDIPAMGAAWGKFNQVYLGGGISIDPYHLWTNFEVRKYEDLQGYKIGAPGPVVNWVKGTGAVGVSGNLTTYYNAIKTGVYDGVIVFATAAAPSKIYEVAPHITQVDFGTAYAGGITANQDIWDGLPEEVKLALRKGVSAYSEAFYAEQEQRIAGAYKLMQEAGVKIYELPEVERIRWAQALPNTAKAWAADLEKQGLPGRQVLEGFMDGLRARGETPPRAWDKE